MVSVPTATSHFRAHSAVIKWKINSAIMGINNIRIKWVTSIENLWFSLSAVLCLHVLDIYLGVAGEAVTCGCSPPPFAAGTLSRDDAQSPSAADE